MATEQAFVIIGAENHLSYERPPLADLTVSGVFRPASNRASAGFAITTRVVSRTGCEGPARAAEQLRRLAGNSDAAT